MAFLKRQTKRVLLLLAEEFNTNVSERNKVLEVIDAITKAQDYEEETAKIFLERILDELKRVELDKDKDRQFELERLKLQSATETASNASMNSSIDSVPRKASLKDLVPKFDPGKIDISLFFMIFERQARREKLGEEHWVAQLIPLLPIDVAEIIIKQPEEQADNYQHIKQVLFKRFKLSSRALRLKFESHAKKQDALWIDLVYELNGYLENWLDAMEVRDFDSLKQLMLTEQLKKRIPAEVREHYVDVWDEVKVAKDLAEKCDKFESIRKDHKKFETRNFSKNTFKTAYKYAQNQDKNYKGKNPKPQKKRIMAIMNIISKNKGKSFVTNAG